MFRHLATLAIFASAMGQIAIPSMPSGGSEQAVADHPRRVLAFIVNKSNPVDNLSHQELGKVFLGERAHWANGRRVTVVMQAQAQEAREAVLRLIYRMGESDYKRYLVHATFTGELQTSPKVLSTAAGVRSFVCFVPGAIGYVWTDQLDDSVKVIKVDGFGPDEMHYKFALNVR